MLSKALKPMLGFRVRRLADLDLRAAGRRHLHEGCRRRRRSGRQGRGRHPGRRPAQPGGDRRQRRRQRRRLRRHGRRPVRDLCGDADRDDGARCAGREERGDGGSDLPADARRCLDHRLDHRLLLRQGLARHEERDAGAVQRPGGCRCAVADRVLLRHHRVHAGRRARCGHAHEAVRHLRRRPGADRRAGLDHRVLHRHAVQPGAAHRAGLDHRPRHQHHRGPGRLDALDRVAGAVRLRRDPRRRTGSPACTASRSPRPRC